MAESTHSQHNTRLGVPAGDEDMGEMWWSRRTPS